MLQILQVLQQFQVAHFNCDSVIIATGFGSTKGFYIGSMSTVDSVLIEGTYFSDRRPTGQIYAHLFRM
ncbi:MAG: hypothetical protein IPH96_05935 [Saprospiraceae bacterium]|nr:hypothetical protein [Saprospiraceae bacterium]